jgi:hypothetical protein
MTWVKLDDQFPDHPKVVGLSDAGLACWIRGLCYASRHLTDGYIPVAALRGLGTTKAADELLATGLWTDAEDGWQVSNYTEHQRSRADVEADRASAAERARKSRERRAARAAASQRTYAEVTEPEAETETDKSRAPTPVVVQDPPPSLSAKQRQEVVSKACQLIGDRAVARGNVQSGAAVARAAFRDYHETAYRILNDDPTLTPAALVGILEPDAPKPPQPANTSARIPSARSVSPGVATTEERQAQVADIRAIREQFAGRAAGGGGA